MERTTVYLDAAIKRRLKAESKRRRIPEAEIIREALHAHLERESPPPFRPVGKSRDGGVARDLDRALAESGFGGRTTR